MNNSEHPCHHCGISFRWNPLEMISEDVGTVSVLLSRLSGAGCWLIFIWAVKKGQFEDVEKPKHRMLDDLISSGLFF